MARYTGAVCRLCRREGTKLFLKGERCYTPKCAVDRRGYPPGQHGQGRKRVSDVPHARKAEGPSHLRPTRTTVQSLLRLAARRRGHHR